MSVCSPCLQVCNVPLCTEEIIIGTISSVSTDVSIVIENKTTGRKQIVSTQSDGDGLVTLVTAGLGLMAGQSYEISIILSDAPALCDRETITIQTSSASCVTVQFENIKDTVGCQVAFASQTLTLISENAQPGTDCVCVTQEMLDELEAGARPYKVYSAIITQQGITEGPLEIGVEYRIVTYTPGDDFLNVGATANAAGEVFVATGTTPTNYSNFSYLTTNKPPTVTVLENGIGAIVWGYVAQSLYSVTLLNAFPLNKTWWDLAKVSNTNQFMYRQDTSTLLVQTSVAVIGPSNNPGDPISWIGADGELFENSIEIRVYD